MTAEAGLPGYRLVGIPGDGVGPDVVTAAKRVLAAVGARFGFGIAWQEIVVGGRDRRVRHADPPRGPGRLRGERRGPLGAVGGPKWDDRPPRSGPSRRCSPCAAGWACSPTSAR